MITPGSFGQLFGTTERENERRVDQRGFIGDLGLTLCLLRLLWFRPAGVAGGGSTCVNAW